METALNILLSKYNIAVSQPYQLKRDNISTDHTLLLLPGYEFSHSLLKTNHIPLLTWRVKRRFTELEKIVGGSVIKDPCLFRFCNLDSGEKYSLHSLIYRELDLCEFIGNGVIISVTAVFNGDQAGNIILQLNNGILCSIEVSVQLPPDTPVIERHELIARRGVASDLVVDTQLRQHSVYTFTDKRKHQYTDIDEELMGFDESEVDHIRSAFMVLKDPGLTARWQKQHDHLIYLVKSAFESDRKRQSMEIK